MRHREQRREQEAGEHRLQAGEDLVDVGRLARVPAHRDLGARIRGAVAPHCAFLPLVERRRLGALRLVVRPQRSRLRPHRAGPGICPRLVWMRAATTTTAARTRPSPATARPAFATGRAAACADPHRRPSARRGTISPGPAGRARGTVAPECARVPALRRRWRQRVPAAVAARSWLPRVAGDVGCASRCITCPTTFAALDLLLALQADRELVDVGIGLVAVVGHAVDELLRRRLDSHPCPRARPPS